MNDMAFIEFMESLGSTQATMDRFNLISKKEEARGHSDGLSDDDIRKAMQMVSALDEETITEEDLTHDELEILRLKCELHYEKTRRADLIAKNGALTSELRDMRNRIDALSQLVGSKLQEGQA